MDDVDIQENADRDDEDTFLRDVIAGEPDLLFLDSYLRDTFTPSAGRPMPALAGGGEALFDDGESA